ncbi:acyl carrier protein [Kordiimonas aestuarii]|uniref:acyl carrier protein n=1 Tax=Kordiimonas aestuarii TaxID=1005925 RepID=UPI0021D36353|nr:acyl carrier protein [Kordiimonas aestuarii]
MGKSQVEIEGWIQKYIRSVLETGSDALPTDTDWTDLGLDSVELVIMAGVLEDDFDIAVDPHILIEYSTISTFSQYLSDALNQKT